MPNNRDRKSAHGEAREITDCRAESVGIVGFAECLRAGPNACAYALPFGYAFLCRHPRTSEIIENTHKEKPSRAAAQSS